MEIKRLALEQVGQAVNQPMEEADDFIKEAAVVNLAALRTVAVANHHLTAAVTFAVIVFVGVAKGCLFRKGCVVTARTGLIGVPAGFFASRRFRIVIHIGVVKRFDRFDFGLNTSRKYETQKEQRYPIRQIM